MSSQTSQSSFEGDDFLALLNESLTKEYSSYVLHDYISELLESVEKADHNEDGYLFSTENNRENDDFFKQCPLLSDFSKDENEMESTDLEQTKCDAYDETFTDFEKNVTMLDVQSTLGKKMTACGHKTKQTAPTKYDKLIIFNQKFFRIREQNDSAKSQVGKSIFI